MDEKPEFFLMATEIDEPDSLPDSKMMDVTLSASSFPIGAGFCMGILPSKRG
jgi:hypothetical protein